MKSKILKNKKIDLSKFYVLFALIALCIILSIFTRHFLTLSNLSNILLQSSINATLAFGMTYVIMTGGIDLSVGSILALSGVIMGKAIVAGTPITLCFLIAIFVGAFCGFINGILVSQLNIPAFITTLGMMSMARGMALTLTNGRAITGFPLEFSMLSTINIAGIQLMVWLMILVFIVSLIILNYTRFGRSVISTGGNLEATRLSGINTKMILTMVYIISGIACGIAGFMYTVRLNVSQPAAAEGYELDAIAATVIGGCSLSGGEGNILGTLIGALIISVLNNGMNLLNVSSYLQQFIIGVVIIVAVLVDRFKK